MTRGGRAGAGAAAAAAGLLTVAASAAGAAQPMPIMMLIGCIEASDDGRVHLVRATDPEPIAEELPPPPAPTAPLGAGRVRLIGTLDEFGVARHVGRKVWAKGLLIEDGTGRRLNLVSITRLSSVCE